MGLSGHHCHLKHVFSHFVSWTDVEMPLPTSKLWIYFKMNEMKIHISLSVSKLNWGWGGGGGEGVTNVHLLNHKRLAHNVKVYQTGSDSD